MKIIHLADIHLGYRAYNRITSKGINRREADVSQAFRSALISVAASEPDLIIIAGDLFHVVRPSNIIIQQTFKDFAMLRAKTKAPIVIIGGNHDSPRSIDTGCILDLYKNLPEIYVVHTKYEQIDLPELDTSICCLCHRSLAELSNLKLEPDSQSKYNILTVHGTVEGVIHSDYDIHEIKRDDVISDKWDYIAFGHYHGFEKLAENAFYSGSIEYTSTNIWKETAIPKGYIEYDLEGRKLIDFHQLETRDVVDLRPIDAQDFNASDINKMIIDRISSIKDGHQDKIVRLIIENLQRSVQQDLDFAMIRKIRSEALHFELVFRKPAKILRDGSVVSAGTARPIELEWEEYAGIYQVPISLDKEIFKTNGLNYLTKFKAEEQNI